MDIIPGQKNRIALLINEWDSQVSCKNNHGFGAQALLLPSITSSYDNFVKDGNVIKLICTICGVLACDDVTPFTVALPSGLKLVATEDLIGVFSKEALTLGIQF